MPTDAAARTPEQKLVDHVGYANAALEKAAAQMAQQEKQAAAAASFIPACVNALVENRRILPTEKQAAEAILRGPVAGIIDLLTKVAAHRNPEEMARLGQPDGPVKKASNSLTSSYVGGRKTTVRESDRRLFAGLNLPLPTDAGA